MMLFSSSSVASSSSTILQELLIGQNLLLHNSNPQFPATVLLGKLYKKKKLICGEVVAKPHIFYQAPWHVHENRENVEYIGPKQLELAVLSEFQFGTNLCCTPCI